MQEDRSARPGSVTIVVPAYNVEVYLQPCLDSLQAQTVWSDCRVIVVDDGSTDRTAAVADAAAAADPRISVLHQANCGPGAGAARNHGLDRVDSEFVMFCDGDDELAPAAVQRLRDGMQRFRTDLAVGATEQFPEPREWLWSPYLTAGEVSSVEITEVPLLAHNAATGNKMFRVSRLRASGLRFAEGIHHQDTVLTVPSLVEWDRLALVGDVVYRYRKRAEGTSVMDSHFTRTANFWDHLQVIETLAGRLLGLAADRRPLMEAFIARSFQGFASRAPGVLPSQQLPEFFRRTRAVLDQLSAASISAATSGPRQRAAYVAIRENDFHTFANLDRRVGQLEAHGGDLHLGIPTSTPEHRELVRTGATLALVSGLTLTSGAIGFDVTVRVRGVRSLPEGLLSLGLRVQPAAGGDPVLVVDLALQPDEGTRSRARVTLPRKGLAKGEYLLRLGFRTPTGETARWVRRPAAPQAPAAPGAGPPGGAQPGGYLPDEEVSLRFRGRCALRSRGDRALLVIG